VRKSPHIFAVEDGFTTPPNPLQTVKAVVMAAYPIWLDALARVVSRTGVHSVGLATQPDEAIDLISELDASLFVMDAGGGEFDATLEHIRAVKEIHPDLRVILVGDRDELELVERAFDAGVFAYLLRSADPGDLEATVRQAFSNSIFLASGSTPRAPKPSATTTPAVAPPRLVEDVPLLTRREREILQLAAAGRSNAELARRLWVTEQTVKFHLSNVYRKLNVSNRTEASRWAQLHGLLDAPPATSDVEAVG
jgi:DNA-binding NarL/FixJ family response regulator